jgi:hypothetical protein
VDSSSTGQDGESLLSPVQISPGCIVQNPRMLADNIHGSQSSTNGTFLGSSVVHVQPHVIGVSNARESPAFTANVEVDGRRNRPDHVVGIDEHVHFDRLDSSHQRNEGDNIDDAVDPDGGYIARGDFDAITEAARLRQRSFKSLRRNIRFLKTPNFFNFWNFFATVCLNRLCRLPSFFVFSGCRKINFDFFALLALGQNGLIPVFLKCN